jgi:hypothetical protein
VLVEWVAVCCATRPAAAAGAARLVDGGGLPAGAKAFCQTWRVAETHNYDAYLAKLGLSWAARRMIAAVNRFTVTYTIVDGVLHGDTDIPRSQHDVFRTEAPVQLAMMGFEVEVRYAWEGAALVATMRGERIADGKPITVRRSVDDTGTLVAESVCDGVAFTRTYRPTEE